ncbi:hypothetical protein M3Y99_01898800 [Aphelenchoides fujianensis]|nr:hypothetical protein M3Y99_01898800 [Aphelenchoides fujianensis]
MFSIRRRLLTRLLIRLLFVLLATALVLMFVLLLNFTSTGDDYEVPGDAFWTTTRSPRPTSTTASSPMRKRVVDVLSLKLLRNDTQLDVKPPVGPQYPRRWNMTACPPVYGKVGVFVAMVASSYERFYRVAQESLKCYLKSTNYTFVLVDLWNDARVAAACPHKHFFFRKHCASSVYLTDFDWMLVLDADAGVVNPNHCIEEWIDDSVDLVFYERFFNWEIASGNYLAKNTKFARDFLRKWADWEYTQPQNWNGADNGVLQMHILQTVLPDAKAEHKACNRIWHRGTNYETYMAFVQCCKVFLGAHRVWPGKLRVLRRAHGFVRDWHLTMDAWSPYDFMLHGWKNNEIDTGGWESPFESAPNATECTGGLAGWNWRNKKRKSVVKIRKMLADLERSAGRDFPKVARVHPYLSEPDVGECYPHC